MAIEGSKDSNFTFDPSLTTGMEGYKPIHEGYKPVNEGTSKPNISTSGYKPERNQIQTPVKIKPPQKK
ncbi:MULTISPECIES: hypothetical protein [Pectobacterium]|uniref:hypothetical protein n=1 Tax=Pectobacterium TaxID=122277 RepID=UPI0013FD881C|nr:MULTISPECIES: hypothetical protein [Pectobacterium]UVD99413.1 hypothetical protein NV347_10695 [Pectobacterium parvum]